MERTYELAQRVGYLEQQLHYAVKTLESIANGEPNHEYLARYVATYLNESEKTV